MKNTVIKGTGTSRALKAPSDMPTTFDAWRAQLLAGTATLDIALNPDGCDVVGTPLSKANLLSDATKEAIGLESEDPTVDEALAALDEKAGSSTALTGSGAPTTSTEGVVGQLYINTTDGSIYACTLAEATGYTWQLKTWVTESQLSSGLATKQNASTAITTSNIGSQTVNKAKLATDDVATGTAGLRNQYFSASEQTPTVNGQICWLYG